MKWIFGNAKFTVPLECNLIFLTWQSRGSARHKSILQQIFQLQLLKELKETSSNLKKILFVKLNRLRSYWAVTFVFSAILQIFLEIWWSYACHILATKWGFQKRFSHLSSSLSISLSKLLTCHSISWMLCFAVNLMKSFSHQKPFNSKIPKHTIVGNTKFYYLAKSQLKRLKIEKLVWKRSLFDDS